MSAVPLRSIEEQDYYHGSISRDSAEAMLKVPGDFLVRYIEANGTEQASYVMSVALSDKREEKKEGYGPYQVKHFVVQKSNDMYTLDSNTFTKDVLELVEKYHKNNMPVPNSSKEFFKTPIKKTNWELQHEWIELGEELGAGQFGVVCKAMLKAPERPQRQVAVKVAKGVGSSDQAKLKEMMDEARVMRDFNHPNVISLIGVATTKEPLMLVMEYMPLGDIKTYLEKNKVSVAQKTKVVMQTGQGIAYLHTRKCIHRDIAARNVLASGTIDNLEVKISDFGLTREGDRYKIKTERPLPVRWLAPEVLINNTFEIRSDVWSFAQTVMEIFSDGQEPFHYLTKEQARDEIKQYKGPKIAPGMPEKMYEGLVKYAWVPLKERQPMAVLIDYLTKVMANVGEKTSVTAEERTKTMKTKGTNSDRKGSVRQVSGRNKKGGTTQKKKGAATTEKQKRKKA